MRWKITFKKVNHLAGLSLDQVGNAARKPEELYTVVAEGETVADSVHNAEAILAGSPPEGTTPEQWVACQGELCDEQVDQNPR
ncbi:hypothetical protein LCGC14_1957500 [marine sediment metagenome]|uniref:Uncharacterized protein n=1 Tax=marine sediment metagenome TaxID=412755 RepID=A0A0F9G3V7_9ZZZZ